MHAVLVTFHAPLVWADLEQAVPDKLWTMPGVPGLLYMTWIHAGARLGSYQVFTDRHAAEHYLGGKLFRQVRTNPAFSDFEIRHFKVVGPATPP